MLSFWQDDWTETAVIGLKMAIATEQNGGVSIIKHYYHQSYFYTLSNIPNINHTIIHIRFSSSYFDFQQKKNQ